MILPIKRLLYWVAIGIMVRMQAVSIGILIMALVIGIVISAHTYVLYAINIDSTAISYYTPPLGERKDNKELCL